MPKSKLMLYRNSNHASAAYNNYYGRVKQSTTIDAKELCTYVARDSGIDEGHVMMVFNALIKQMEEQLCNGHPITIDGFFSAKVGIKSKGVSIEDVKKRVPGFDPENDDITKYLSANQVISAHLLLTASERIRTLLRSIKFETDKSDWEELS